ncbi:MAG: hypothetical protein AB7H86_20700 [Blastocatellales bacterium]
MSNVEDRDINKDETKTVKFTYNSPKLRKYGTVGELTLTAQKAKSSDNPGKDMNMTG